MSALSGIKVLELAESVSGEYCGKLLADFGADVIKVERPGCGSPTRRLGPIAGGEADGEHSGLFAYLNTNKCSVTLDLTSDAGTAALDELLGRVDAVVDDHSAEWLQNAGLNPGAADQRHPELVLCSVTPYGLNPPEDRRHAEDLNVFHSSGWGYHTPSAETVKPPLNGAGRFLPSYEAGLEAAMCVVASLYERDESGQGRVIDVSGQEVLASRIDYVLGQMIAGDMDVSTERTAFDLGGPAGFFACRDGYTYIWMSAPAHWEALRQLLGHPEWMESFPEHWMERECTPERVAECRHYLAEWLKTQNKREAEEQAQKLGLTLVAVNNPGDLLESPQYRFRQFFAEVEHPVLGRAPYPTVPYRLGKTPVAIASPAPRLGQDTAARLGELGVTAPAAAGRES